MNHILRKGAVIVATMALLPFVAATSAKAQTVYIDPISATSSGGDVSSPTLAIDGSGMSGTISTGTPVTTPVTADNNTSNMWINSSFGLTPTLTLNLSAGYTLTGIDIWNENDTSFGGSDAPTATTISYSTNNGATYFSLGSFGLTTGNGTSAEAAQTFSLGTLTGVTNIQLGLSGQNNGFSSTTGLSEVRLLGTAAVVPEPSTWAMMFAGLGALVVLARRRNQIG